MFPPILEAYSIIGECHTRNNSSADYTKKKIFISGRKRGSKTREYFENPDEISWL